MGAYREPSVNITQVQETLTVNAGITDLMSGIIGPSYDVIELDDYIYPWNTTASGTIPITLSGVTVDECGTIKEIDEDSIYVEFVTKTGTLIPFTGSLSVTDNIATLTDSNNDLSGYRGSGTLEGFRPKVAYRAQFIDRYKETFISTTEDVQNSVGRPVLENPLGFASKIMLQNSNAEFMVYPTKLDGSAQDFTSAMDALENSTVYAFAPLTQDKDNTIPDFVQWTKDRSLPENGHPSKLYVSPKIVWYKADGSAATGKQLEVVDGTHSQTKFSFVVDQLDTTAKLYTAQNIAAMNGQTLEKRVSSIYPDMGWILVEKNILQLEPGFVAHISDVDGGMAVLARTVILTTKEILHAGTIVNDTIWEQLIDKTLFADNKVSVWYPVSGYYLAVQQAALVSALSPSEPKTQQPVSGIQKISYSETYFGKEYTNIIAGGGTNVIVQPTLSVLPASRHHMTTDATTTQTREDNIVHQVDVVTMNYIMALRPLVGRYKQTNRFYKLLRAILTAYAEQFKQKDYIKDIQILEVKQDPNTPDKVLVVLRVLPFYAANYIDVTIYY